MRINYTSLLGQPKTWPDDGGKYIYIYYTYTVYIYCNVRQMGDRQTDTQINRHNMHCIRICLCLCITDINLIQIKQLQLLLPAFLTLFQLLMRFGFRTQMAVLPANQKKHILCDVFSIYCFPVFASLSCLFCLVFFVLSLLSYLFCPLSFVLSLCLVFFVLSRLSYLFCPLSFVLFLLRCRFCL